MRSARPRDVKPPTLLLITTATLGFACHRNQAPTNPGAYAQSPPSAESQAPTIPEPPPIGIAIDPGAPNPVPVREAVAILMPLRGSRVTGVVRFRENSGQLDVIASVDGLPPGPHAYHVHVYGDCSSPDGESAGPHFNFAGSSFGESRMITGNLGELRPEGKPTSVQQTRIQASLQGPFSIIGRAVIVHEHGNDPMSPPDGAAGKRLACGAIGIAGPAPSSPQATTRY
jgi:superoxide dismutase, Cu-Zn family